MERILYASGRGDVDYLKNYLELRNFSIDVTNKKGFSALFMAVNNGSLQHLKTLISAGADVNKVRYKHLKISTPVMIAVKKNRLSCLQALIKAGANPFLYISQNIVFPKNVQDVKTLTEAGANPIEMITHLQDENCLKFLCENKIDGVERNTSLLLFSQVGKHLAVKALIQAGADINIVDKDGNSPLMMASKFLGSINSGLACVQILFEAGANVNAANTQGDTALILAVKWNSSTHYLLALLQAGASCNLQNTNGKTALMFAVENKKKDFFELLLKHKANVNLQEKNGKTVLMYAAKIEDLTWCQKLLEHKADVKIQDKEGRNAIMFAIIHKHVDVCQFLVHKFDLEIQDKYGRTALHFVCDFSNDLKGLKSLDILLQAGANLNKQDRNGRTILMYAVEMGNKNCCELLLKHKAHVNMQDKDGKTALMYAAEIRDPTWCQKLIEHKADVKIQDKEGKNAIIFAVMHENKEVCQFLEMQDKYGRTALDYVCDIYTPNPRSIDICVKNILQAGANVNKQDKYGTTVLMEAVKFRNKNCLEVLLKHKADVNTQDKRGKTALMYSAEMRDIDCCQLLINGKADVNIQDEDGKTALMHAVSNNVFKCAETLFLAGADTELKDKSNCSALVHLLRCHKESITDFYETLMFFLDKGVSPALDPCHRKLLHCIPEVYRPRYRATCHRSQGIRNLTIEWTLIEGKAELTRLLVCNGVVSEWFDAGVDYKSALGCALHCRQYGVVKYFLANCYLTHKDISDLRHRFKGQSSTLKLPRHEMSDEEVDLNIITAQAVCQPWPLVKLAFISVSTALGPGPDRQKSIAQTRLPDRLQRMLMFQEPVSRLPVSEWEDIPLTFDPVEYEKLPKPRPLLYYWPVGRDLVV